MQFGKTNEEEKQYPITVLENYQKCVQYLSWNLCILILIFGTKIQKYVNNIQNETFSVMFQTLFPIS